MFKEFLKINKELGESRRDQILGIVILIAVVLFVIFK
jgi:hypothetical protein